MANSTSNIDGIINGQGSQDLVANAVFNAVSPAATYARRASTCIGLTWGYYGGTILVNGTLTQVANSTIVLFASATNYIEAHPDTGVVSANIIGFTPGYVALYSVVTNATSVTSWTEQRFGYELNNTLTIALSNANTTLTQPQAAATVLNFTGTLTQNRVITLPLVGKKTWIVYNGTNQSLEFKGSTGTGYTVYSGEGGHIKSDGTNIINALPQITPQYQTVTTDSTTTRTAPITDRNSWIRFTNSAAVTYTIPANSTVAFTIGESLNGVQGGSGQVSIVGAGGVTINRPSGYNAKTRAQGSSWGLVKVDTDTWDLIGDLEVTPT